MKWFIFRIIRDHFNSLEPKWNIVMHVVPTIACIPFMFFHFKISQGQLGAIIAAVSIYSALMFGILVPASDQCRRLKKYKGGPSPTDTTTEKLRLAQLSNHYDVAKGILANISFSIVISVIDVLFLIVALCLTPDNLSRTFLPSASLNICLILGSYFFGLLLVLLLVIVRTIYGSWLEEDES